MTSWPPTRPGLLKAMLSAPVGKTAIRVALLVGTLLNLVNQGEAMIHGMAPDWPRVALNYLVPFLVSAWSGARAVMTAANPDRR